MNRFACGRRLMLVVTGIAAISLNGCLLAPVAALGVAGNVADIGSTAFSAGTEVFSSGQLESVEFCTFEQAQAAVRSTLNDLRLRVGKMEFTKSTGRYRVVDDSKSEVDFDLTQRTPAICQIRIDVGMFGSEAYARLLLKSVRARLPSVSDRPTTAPTDPVDLLAPKSLKGFSTDNLDH